jgi:hypothetical protein
VLGGGIVAIQLIKAWYEAHFFFKLFQLTWEAEGE